MRRLSSPALVLLIAGSCLVAVVLLSRGQVSRLGGQVTGGSPGTLIASPGWNSSLDCRSQFCNIAYVGNNTPGALTPLALYFVHCTSATCDEKTVQVLDDLPVYGIPFLRLRCTYDGCAVAYIDHTRQTLTFLSCQNDACSSVTRATLPLTPVGRSDADMDCSIGNLGMFCHLALGADGLAVCSQAGCSFLRGTYGEGAPYCSGQSPSIACGGDQCRVSFVPGMDHTNYCSCDDSACQTPLMKTLPGSGIIQCPSAPVCSFLTAGLDATVFACNDPACTGIASHPVNGVSGARAFSCAGQRCDIYSQSRNLIHCSDYSCAGTTTTPLSVDSAADFSLSDGTLSYTDSQRNLYLYNPGWIGPTSSGGSSSSLGSLSSGGTSSSAGSTGGSGGNSSFSLNPSCLSSAATCDEPGACGPTMGLMNWRCANGCGGGPTGRCLRHPDGSCGWEVNWCQPASSTTSGGGSSVAPCAPASMPDFLPGCAFQCPDGTVDYSMCDSSAATNLGTPSLCQGHQVPPCSSGGSSSSTSAQGSSQASPGSSTASSALSSAQSSNGSTGSGSSASASGGSSGHSTSSHASSGGSASGGSAASCPFDFPPPPPGCFYSCFTDEGGCRRCSTICSHSSSSRSAVRSASSDFRSSGGSSSACIPPALPVPPPGCHYECRRDGSGCQSCVVICSTSSTARSRGSSASAGSQGSGGSSLSGSHGSTCSANGSCIGSSSSGFKGSGGSNSSQGSGGSVASRGSAASQRSSSSGGSGGSAGSRGSAGSSGSNGSQGSNPSCDTSLDCAGGLCLNNHCVGGSSSSPRSCTSDRECPGGACVNGVCGCGTDEQCPTRRCVNGACLPCDRDDECASHRCDAGVCAVLSCAASDQCPSGLCLNRTCTSCTADVECLSGQCNGGVCTPLRTAAETLPAQVINLPAACTADEQCASHRCRDGQCVPCASDDDCGAGQSCENDHCEAKAVRTVAGDGWRCLTDTECAAGQRCVSGQCERIGCSVNTDCRSGRCLNGECVACITSDDCGAGRQCLGGRCVVSPTSAPSSAKTGPESIAIVAAGAAAGFSWVRRRRPI